MPMLAAAACVGVWVVAAGQAPDAPAAPWVFEPFEFQPFAAPQGAGAPSRQALVESVAHDTYLGGSGVAGPLALLGTAVNLVVEPALGALAAVLSQDHANERKGTITRSTAAAYGKTLSYMGSFVVLWAVSIPLWGVLVLVVPAAVGLGVVFGAGLPVAMALQAGVGVALLLGSLGALGVLLWVGVPWFVGRLVGLWVGNTIFDALGTGNQALQGQDSNQGELDKLINQKALGPLPPLRAGVLLAAVAGGVMERNLRWDGLPVVGPFITAAKVSSQWPGRLNAALQVAGMDSLAPSVAPRIGAMVWARSGLLAAAQAFCLSAPLLVAAGATALLASALIPGVGLLPGVTLLGAALALSAGLVMLGVLCGGAAFVANVMLPWAVVLLVSTAAKPT